MLSTFFSTSRPIHYLMVFIVVAIAVVSSLWWSVNVEWWNLSGIIILSACLAVFQFIVSKNDLTPSSSFALWSATIFTLLYLTFNVALSSLLALLFLLLALRRLLSLKTGRATIKKVFDATFWIAIATIFYQWSALFYLVVFVAIFLYARNDYRNWVTPFIAMGCVWFLLFTYDYVWEYHVLGRLWNSYQLDYLWSDFLITGNQVILLALLVAAVIGLLVYLSKLIDIQQSVRPRFTIMTFAGLCSIIIAILNFESFSQAGFLFLIPSLAILIARFVHTLSHKIVRELVLWLPIFLLLFSFALY